MSNIFLDLFKRRKKNIQYIKRNEKTLIELKLAFFGATNNFYLLEENLFKIKNINIYQYNNYLCQIAFCIELGLKSLIIDRYKVEKTHDLYKLFTNTPIGFQNKFKEIYNDKKLFDYCFSNTKYLFIYLRYMQLSNLRLFLDKNIINIDSSINIEKSLEQEMIKFLQDLLEEIIDFHKEKRKMIFNEISNNEHNNEKNLIKDIIDKLEML